MGSFFLTPVTAVRYDKYDRKVQRMSQEEAMGLEKDRRKVDINEEYYVSEPYHDISPADPRHSNNILTIVTIAAIN